MGELRYFPRHVVEIISCVARPKKEGNVKLRRAGLFTHPGDRCLVRQTLDREVWV